MTLFDDLTLSVVNKPTNYTIAISNVSVNVCLGCYDDDDSDDDNGGGGDDDDD